jgi:CBS-domain-containing membrane protein
MQGIYQNIANYFISIICFLSIFLFHQLLGIGDENTLIIAAFGASAVLAFSNNVINHSFVKIFTASIIAAIIGVFCNQLNLTFLVKVTLAISACILIMNLFKISYPPAGAIAIIPLISNTQLQELGYLYVCLVEYFTVF